MKLVFISVCLSLVIGIGSLSALNVLTISGSNRVDSVNKKLLHQVAKIANQADTKVIDINLKDFEMPFYDGDLEAKRGMPEQVKRFRDYLKNSDVIFISSPEYNGSVSAVLKNAIDWSSRDEKGNPSREAFEGKKFVLLSASPGPGGGSRGLVHLKSIIENVGGTVLPQTFSLSFAYAAFDENGNLKDANIEKEIRQLVLKGLR